MLMEFPFSIFVLSQAVFQRPPFSIYFKVLLTDDKFILCSVLVNPGNAKIGD